MNSGRCQCGRSRVWHEKEGITVTDTDEKWQPNDEYTSKTICDAFGVIEFRGFGQDVTRRVPVSMTRNLSIGTSYDNQTIKVISVNVYCGHCCKMLH